MAEQELDSTKDPFRPEFSADQIFYLSNGAITLQMLERIVEIINKHGKIALLAVGQTSILDMLMSLVVMAEKIKEQAEHGERQHS